MRVMKLHSQAGHVYAILFGPNPGSGDDNELVPECIQGILCLWGSLVSGVMLLHGFQDCSDKGLRRIQNLNNSPKMLVDFGLDGVI